MPPVRFLREISTANIKACKPSARPKLKDRLAVRAGCDGLG